VFQNIRIRSILLFSSLIIVISVLITGMIVSLASLRNTAVRTINNVTVLNNLNDYNAAVNSDLFNLLYISDVNLTDYIIQTTKENKEILYTHFHEYIKYSDQFSGIFSPGEMQTMENLSEMYEKTYIPVVDEIINSVENNRRDAAIDMYISRFVPIFGTYTYYINALFIKNLDYSLIKTKNNRSASFFAILILAVVLLSLIVSVDLMLAVTKSIKERHEKEAAEAASKTKSANTYAPVINTESSEIIKSNFSNARILIVDDMLTNLKVAEGLLSDYKLNIDTCKSGKESIDLVKKNDYDIIFMDHLMPEMNGIEAAAIIRAWEDEQKASGKKRTPIIALTANDVAGIREMFIDNGFDDFIAKPINISQMDEILEKLLSEKKGEMKLSDEKVETKKETFTIKISGVDTEKGIGRTGGKIENYIFVLNMFYKDAVKRVPFFQELPDENNISLFITHAHALKSAAASIGADDISKKALDLEKAGNSADFPFIKENLNVFAADLAELLANISKAKDQYTESLSQKSNENALSDIESLINELKSSLLSKKASSEIFKVIEKINKKPLDAKIREMVEKISFHTLMNEYDEAIKIISSS